MHKNQVFENMYACNIVTLIKNRDVFFLTSQFLNNVCLFFDVIKFAPPKIHIRDPQTLISPRDRPQIRVELFTQKAKKYETKP